MVARRPIWPHSKRRTREAFENALARNILQERAAERTAELARYGRSVIRELDTQQDSALMRGELAFPSLEAFGDAQR